MLAAGVPACQFPAHQRRLSLLPPDLGMKLERLLRGKHLDIWEAFAREIGGSWNSPGMGDTPHIEVAHARGPLVIEGHVTMVMVGKVLVPVVSTRFRRSCPPPARSASPYRAPPSPRRLPTGSGPSTFMSTTRPSKGLCVEGRNAGPRARALRRAPRSANATCATSRVSCIVTTTVRSSAIRHPISIPSNCRCPATSTRPSVCVHSGRCSSETLERLPDGATPVS